MNIDMNMSIRRTVKFEGMVDKTMWSLLPHSNYQPKKALWGQG